MIELLKLVDTQTMVGECLRKVARRVLNPTLLLRAPDHRKLLIATLPPNKQRELAFRIGLPENTDSDVLSDEVSTKSRMISLLEFFGIEPEARTFVEVAAAHMTLTPSYALFEHQMRLVNEAWAKLESKTHTVVLHMPTGGGKTRSAMHLIAQHLRSYPASVVVWLAHSRELLSQAAEEFEKAWKLLGNRPVDLVRMWGDFAGDPLSIKDGLVVAGFQKLHYFKQNRFDDFLRLADRAHLTVVDEAHVATAPTYHDLISGLWSKRQDNRLLGLTATPGRTWADIAVDQELSDLFKGQKVTLEVDGYDNPVSYLIEEGYLAHPTFRLMNAAPGLRLTPEDEKALAERFEIPDDMLERLGESPARNLRIVESVNELATRHRRIIVFAPSVASAKTICAVLNVQNITGLCITADTDASERQRAIDHYKRDSDDTIVLCNYGVLTAGFDAPRTSAAVIARPTLSLVLYSQMVGRALRGYKAGGNAEAEIVTVVDPELPGFGRIEEAFRNWEDVWHG